MAVLQLLQVSRAGLAIALVAVAWRLVSLALVVPITAEAGDFVPEVTDEAVGLWALFLSFVFLPSYVFWLDVQGSRR